MSFDRLDLTAVDNDDPRILTIFVIGTEENVKRFMRSQHKYGFAEVNDWGKLQLMPNGSDKVMTLLNRLMPKAE
jgi:hypothetical protein